MCRKQNHQSMGRLLEYLVNEYTLQFQIQKWNILNDRKMVRKLEEICKSANLYIRCGKSCTVYSWNPQSPLTNRLKAVEGSTNKLMSSWKKSDFICVRLKPLPPHILTNPHFLTVSEIPQVPMSTFLHAKNARMEMSKISVRGVSSGVVIPCGKRRNTTYPNLCHGTVPAHPTNCPFSGWQRASRSPPLPSE